MLFLPDLLKYTPQLFDELMLSSIWLMHNAKRWLDLPK